MARTMRRRAASLLSLDLGTFGAPVPGPVQKAEPEADAPRPDDITETLAKIGAIVRKMAAGRGKAEEKIG
jgi:hypothetical protein